MKRGDLLHQLENNCLPTHLESVYGSAAPQAARRLTELMGEYGDTFPCCDDTEMLLFSTPGRTELGGNHTDHQRGRALAASVDLDTIACVVPNDSHTIRIKSRHHRMAQIDVRDLSPHPEETGSSPALVRGVAARFRQLGLPVGGFDAYTTTSVLRGSGLSSSAAFEVLVATILNHLFAGGALSPTRIAQIGQYAENVYFGKPCGLLDQLACATGGVISVDFRDLQNPHISRVSLDLTGHGYALCIVDSRASHADLTEAYAAIPGEMGQVAAFFGAEHLSAVPREAFIAAVPRLREHCGDRAVLRAHHFYGDDARVPLQHAALQRGDFDAFLGHVRRSGRSSFMYLQNVSPCGSSADQPLAVLLAAAEELLEDRGACRVHGGGFAGTIQAYVPLDLLDRFVAGMEHIGGPGCCLVLRIRNTGSTLLLS